MKQLELEFRKHGYNYKQIWRDELYAIYSQSDETRLIAYEVFKINRNEARDRFGKSFEATESVPPSTQWGNNAWTVKSLEDCETKIAYMKEQARINSLPKGIAKISTIVLLMIVCIAVGCNGLELAVLIKS